MKYIFLLSIFLFPAVSFANVEVYVVEREDGTVAIHSYKTSSSVSLEETLKEAGIEGLKLKQIKPSDIPQTKEHRDAWRFDPITKIVKVDEAKKSELEVLKSEKENSKLAILEKLKISESELETLVKK